MTDEQIDAIWACTDSRGSTTFEPRQWQREMRLRFARALLSASKPAVAWMDPSDQNDATAFTRDANEAHCNPDMFSVMLAASPAAPAQSGEPVAIWRVVRANLNLIANSFANCKGSASTMQGLAKDCLAKVDAYLDAPQPSPTAAGAGR